LFNKIQVKKRRERDETPKKTVNSWPKSLVAEDTQGGRKVWERCGLKF